MTDDRKRKKPASRKLPPEILAMRAKGRKVAPRVMKAVVQFHATPESKTDVVKGCIIEVTGRNDFRTTDKMSRLGTNVAQGVEVCVNHILKKGITVDDDDTQDTIVVHLG